MFLLLLVELFGEEGGKEGVPQWERARREKRAGLPMFQH